MLANNLLSELDPINLRKHRNLPRDIEDAFASYVFGKSMAAVVYDEEVATIRSVVVIDKLHDFVIELHLRPLGRVQGNYPRNVSVPITEQSIQLVNLVK